MFKNVLFHQFVPTTETLTKAQVQSFNFKSPVQCIFCLVESLSESCPGGSQKCEKKEMLQSVVLLAKKSTNIAYNMYDLGASKHCLRSVIANNLVAE